MILLAGVDGGATKTVAVVGRLDGTLLGFARGPASNYHNVGLKNAAESIHATIALACRRAGARPKDLETVVMGLAGMDSPKDFRMGRKVADLTHIGKSRVVKHDSVIALHAATLGKPGIAVNAGTGSFAAGIDAHGRVVRAGGWGNIIDDEGSAYDIGKLAIRSALRALDGREGRTLLSRLLVRHFRLRTLQNIVHEVYEKPMSVDEISAISKLVAYAASRGDRVAQNIFAQEGRVLAKLVSAIAHRLKMTRSKPDVYCVGGVFNAGPILMNPFKQELRKSIPRFTIRSVRFEPAIGAFVVGLQEQHVAAQGRVLANLQTSYARHFGKKH